MDSQASLKSLPSEQDLETDARVSWSRADNCYICVDETGLEWEWREKEKNWFPLDDNGEKMPLEDQKYAKYGMDFRAPIKDQKPERGGPRGKKRKGSSNEPETHGKKEPSSEPPPRQNTAVFVTNLPLDATFDEIDDLFSRNGGAILEDENGNKRIKLYTDEQGRFKGEALIIYLNAISVGQAITLLDESYLSFGRTHPNGLMRVQQADMSYKKHQDDEPQQRKSRKEKIAYKEMKREQHRKVEDWNSDEETEEMGKPKKPIRNADKWVVLKHMFTLKELEDDPDAFDEIIDDVREECAKIAPVNSVLLFDQEPEGVMKVQFSSPDDAQRCVQTMRGRRFGGQAVVAYVDDGLVRFKFSRRAQKTEDDRLDDFGNWLEENSKKKEAAKNGAE
ncbi:hypothetical protein BDY21DRAFT_130815 [Lineolata rhizophorae]|uniref:RRM domain-containing protein n=1 Tax=Lineolata rhizophorae TaxID=578093 RepID=A0A6A6PAD2_9PEZI|nr:hypothetical protein BDY21DRAFT_130815 [Lineolata rhizophorae]